MVIDAIENHEGFTKVRSLNNDLEKQAQKYQKKFNFYLRGDKPNFHTAPYKNNFSQEMLQETQTNYNMSDIT